MYGIINIQLLRAIVIACILLAILVSLFLLMGAHAAHFTPPLQAIVPCGPQNGWCHQ